MITLAQLQAILKTARGRKECERYIDALNEMMPRYGIDSPARRNMFIAQIAHESADFTRVVENLNYSAQGLAATWPGRYRGADKKPNALALRLHRNPEAIANNCYANRMGNGPESSGDGWRYRGAGLKQLTGKNNHRAFGEAVGVPLSEVPDYLQTARGAVESACWFWKENDLGRFADRGDFSGMTRAVNGGLIGLEERQSYLARAVDAVVMA